MNLSQLLSFGRPVTPDSVLASVSYTLTELPRRLASRIRSLEALPFIVGTNPYISKSLNAYRDSLTCLASHPPVTNLSQNAHFVETLSSLVQKHSNDIPTMAKGYLRNHHLFPHTQVVAGSRNPPATCLLPKSHPSSTLRFAVAYPSG